MITDLNRFIIVQYSELSKAEKEAVFCDEDFQYKNGYVQAMKDMRELALDIYHGRNGY